MVGLIRQCARFVAKWFEMRSIARQIKRDGVFESLAAVHAEWSRETFGPDHIRGPVGPLQRLRKETWEISAELVKAVLDPDKTNRDALGYEYADALLLLIDSARRAGIPAADLLGFATRKLRTNMEREWPDWRTSDLNAPLEHLKGE